jgi:hypothetical protein
MQSGNECTPSGSELGEQILKEVKSVFRSASTPQVSGEEVRGAVTLLLKLLAHRIDDPKLDAVGGEIQASLKRWFSEGELIKLADRYEPFCKFVLRLVDLAKFAELKRRDEKPEPGENKPSAAYVLKGGGLGIVSNKECNLFMNASWESFPLATLQGQPNFLEHVGRIYLFRNVDDHHARILSVCEKAEIARSFCVVLVFIVFKFQREIEVALIKAQFSVHLQKVRNQYAGIGASYIELLSEPRSGDEYRYSDQLTSVPDGTPPDDAVPATNLPSANRVVVIEAEPGAGKTTTLKFLAWQHADKLLAGEPGCYGVPLFLDLNLLGHCSLTIEAAIAKELKAAGVTSAIQWDALLLLVDGLNEVTTDLQTGFKREIHTLLSNSLKLRAIIAGRPNSFRKEFEAQLVALKPLSDDQLKKLFQKKLDQDAKAITLLAEVLQNPFLSSWARTPLHACLLARMAGDGDLSSLGSRAQVFRRCIRDFLTRESYQASADVSRTGPETKEPLLARLAFETKSTNENVFTRLRIRQEFAIAKTEIGSSSLDIPKLVGELLDNHLIQSAYNETFEFAHELYHDYFAASELESREQLKSGLGTEFALAHFAAPEWRECIRLFAGLSHTEVALIEQGAERNPFLAWRMLRDANIDSPELVMKIAEEADCALSAQLTTPNKAALAGDCMLVLADLEEFGLLERAIIEQRQTFEPGLWQLSDEDRKLATEKHKQTVVPLAKGLLLLVRLGLLEQSKGQEGRFCQASRVAFQALKEIKAARALIATLSKWTGKNFDASKLVPGIILDTLIDLGVDEVIDREDGELSHIMGEWLGRASEAGFQKAWPAYVRILRCIPEGVEWQPDVALRWARASHNAGDTSGSLELALLLVENPSLENETGEGEQLLRNLTRQGILEAKYELGKRLMKGDGFMKAEEEGFGLLIEAAEADHLSAWSNELLGLGINWWRVPELEQPQPKLDANPMALAPDWSLAFRERWFALLKYKYS